jgi:hypothetical protein
LRIEADADWKVSRQTARIRTNLTSALCADALQAARDLGCKGAGRFVFRRGFSSVFEAGRGAQRLDMNVIRRVSDGNASIDATRSQKGALMFGLFGKKKAVGAIAKVDFSSSGKKAGQLVVGLDGGEDFHLFLDVPRAQMLEIFDLATSALWDGKRVEIAYAKRGGVKVLRELRVI